MSKAVVALAFGIPASLHSNKCVALSASEQAKKLGGVPIFTQLGMKMHYDLPAIQVPGEYPGHWANTMQMAHAAVRWAKENGVTELWVAAATPHMWRSLRDFRYAVAAVGALITIRECPQAKHFTNNDWFRLESEQLHTRSKWHWLLWELPLRCIPMSLYTKLTDSPF